MAETKARLEATKASMGKEISILKEKLEKKAVKVVSYHKPKVEKTLTFGKRTS